jgi:heme/copper-type cytochrome/quinol oxidase subunit 2
MKRILTALCLLLGIAFAGSLLAADTHSPSVFLPDVVSASGHKINDLYMVILGIVTVIFVITEGLLLYSVIAFRARPGRRAQYFHGSTAIELVLAGVPVLILLYLTMVSSGLWSELKLHRPTAKNAIHVQVMGQQFAWNFRFAGADAAFGTADDVMTLNEAYLPVGQAVVFHFSSKDVIHSFFLPESRVKQDCVPGLLTSAWTQWDVLPVWDLKAQKRVLLTPEEYAKVDVAVSGYELKNKPNTHKRWFQASDSAKIGYNEYWYERNSDPLVVLHDGQPTNAEPQYVQHYFEIGCAQLCGTSHFAMRGIVRVVPMAQYQAWLAKQAHDDYLAGTWNGIWDKFHPEFNRSL